MQPRTQVICWRDPPSPNARCPCACTSAARASRLLCFERAVNSPTLSTPTAHARPLRLWSWCALLRAPLRMRVRGVQPSGMGAPPSLYARALPPARRPRACFAPGAKATPPASLLLNAGEMCTCPMPSCDLERPTFQNPPGPGLSEEELQLSVNCTGVATLEGLTETSDVQKLSRACVYSGVRSVGPEEHAGVRAQLWPGG